MDFLALLLLLLILGFVIKKLIDFFKSDPEEPAESESADTISRLYKISDDIDDFFHDTAHPDDLISNDQFSEAVELLVSSDQSDEKLLEYGTGANAVISCIALEALNRREPKKELLDKLTAELDKLYLWPLYFALRVLRQKSCKPDIGIFLSNVQEWWLEAGLLPKFIESFITDKQAQGLQFKFANTMPKIHPDQIDKIVSFLTLLSAEVRGPLLADINRKRERLIDTTYLNRVGKLWESDHHPDNIFMTTVLKENLLRVTELIFSQRQRSVLLVGDSGVGKSVLVQELAKKMRAKNWFVFEAGAVDIIAGQVYIGELEERIQKLIGALNKKRQVVWFIPGFHELLHTGQHRYSPSGVLDMLLPHIENGTILIIGETLPESYEMLLKSRPKIRGTFETIRVAPLPDDETIKLAKQWTALHTKNGTPLISESVLNESYQLIKQFLGEKAAPGNLLDMLKVVKSHTQNKDGAQSEITLDDFLTILSYHTGLPRSILDDRQGLDLEALRLLFQERVKGQSEAVECLTERVAMIKSGLTDPARPLGVFLFAGPTGTGKTEIAKTLSEFLFGSASRMVRLDMSEFQTPDSLNRILGESDERSQSTALVNHIRKQPFSLILLDEFEKAHPKIWDLFLQVFDDGLLTDARGNRVDFRHSIIILTSNLGATIYPGMSIGFSSKSQTFSLTSVEKAVMQTFRREFINRIDRVVVFRPLSTATMREILHKELKDALLRRGLRTREWAVEWEESAIEFLLEKGFTPDLGARPLKRAIERYLLSPLALTIVNHQFPEGDQFLFVRGDGTKINVDFIDPDAPDEKLHETTSDDMRKETIPDHLTLKSLIIKSQGTPAETIYLKSCFDKISDTIGGETWQFKKQDALKATSKPQFWESEERFAVLDRVEVMDRIEAGLETAGSLLNRISGEDGNTRKQVAPKLLSRLAERIYLLDAALFSFENNLTQEAFIIIDQHEGTGNLEQTVQHAHEMTAMYKNWAKNRRMRYRILKEEQAKGRYRFIIAVSGYGCLSILQPENGLHVFESPKSEKSFHRHNIHVRIIPQPLKPISDENEMLHFIEKQIEKHEPANLTVVRRYRREPSPLVRDAAKNWRTGRLDKVLQGDFDLFE